VKDSVPVDFRRNRIDFQIMLRAAGTSQEDIQDWLQLDGGDPGFQLLTADGTAT
jgi:hypothetical protein